MSWGRPARRLQHLCDGLTNDVADLWSTRMRIYKATFEQPQRSVPLATLPRIGLGGISQRIGGCRRRLAKARINPLNQFAEKRQTHTPRHSSPNDEHHLTS